jgi:hypothetical protein
MAQQQNAGAGIATPTPQTNADREAQTKAQKELLDRINGVTDGRTRHTAALMTDSKLTTKEHVGKGKEPHKPDEQEALKVGSAQNAVTLKSSEVSSHESGEATDTVVTEPSILEAVAHPLVHRDDAMGTAAVISEAQGGDRKGAHNRVVGAGPQIVGKGPEMTTEKTSKTVAEQQAENWEEGNTEDRREREASDKDKGGKGGRGKK